MKTIDPELFIGRLDLESVPPPSPAIEPRHHDVLGDPIRFHWVPILRSTRTLCTARSDPCSAQAGSSSTRLARLLRISLKIPYRVMSNGRPSAKIQYREKCSRPAEMSFTHYLVVRVRAFLWAIPQVLPKSYEYCPSSSPHILDTMSHGEAGHDLRCRNRKSPGSPSSRLYPVVILQLVCMPRMSHHVRLESALTTERMQDCRSSTFRRCCSSFDPSVMANCHSRLGLSRFSVTMTSRACSCGLGSSFLSTNIFDLDSVSGELPEWSSSFSRCV